MNLVPDFEPCFDYTFILASTIFQVQRIAGVTAVI